MAPQIRYGEDEEQKKRAQQAAGPTPAAGRVVGVAVPPGAWGASPENPARAPRPTPSPTSTLPVSPREMSAHQPWTDEQMMRRFPQPPETLPPARTRGGGGMGGIGPASPDLVGAASRTAGMLVDNRYGASTLYGGRSLAQVIDDVAQRYGGMENLRARSQGLDLSSRESNPVLGSYLQSIIENGPVGRNQALVMRRYAGNVGQATRDWQRREDQSVGASAAPDILRDVLNAANSAENIGEDAAVQAIRMIFDREAQKEQNLTTIQATGMNNATARANAELGVFSDMAAQDAIAARQEAAAKRAAAVKREALAAETGDVEETLPGGTATAPALPARAQSGGSAAGARARPLPPDYIAQLAGQGWRYLGPGIGKDGKAVHKFRKPGAPDFEVAAELVR